MKEKPFMISEEFYNVVNAILRACHVSHKPKFVVHTDGTEEATDIPFQISYSPRHGAFRISYHKDKQLFVMRFPESHIDIDNVIAFLSLVKSIHCNW